MAADVDDALEPLQRQLAQRFGAVRIECESMPLRAIANALMQNRKRGPQP